jgi:DNA-binding transcriptional regulator LsrR (DeoR family)
MSQMQVASILTVSHHVVQRMLNRFQIEAIVAHEHDGDRSMCTTQAQDRLTPITIVSRNAISLRKSVQNSTNVQVLSRN